MTGPFESTLLSKTSLATNMTLKHSKGLIGLASSVNQSG